MVVIVLVFLFFFCTGSHVWDIHTIHQSEQVYERLHPHCPGISAHKNKVNIYSHRLYTHADYRVRNSRGHIPSHTLWCIHTQNTHTFLRKPLFHVCLRLCCCRCPTLLPSSPFPPSLDRAHFPSHSFCFSLSSPALPPLCIPINERLYK